MWWCTPPSCWCWGQYWPRKKSSEIEIFTQSCSNLWILFFLMALKSLSRDTMCISLVTSELQQRFTNNSDITRKTENSSWKVEKVWVVGVLAGGETVRFMKEIKGCWGASRAGEEGTFAKMQWLNVVSLASKTKPNQKRKKSRLVLPGKI